MSAQNVLRNISSLAFGVGLIILILSIGFWYQNQESDQESILNNQEDALKELSLGLRHTVIDQLDYINHLLSPQFVEGANATSLLDSARYDRIVSPFFYYQGVLRAINYINSSGYIVNVYPHDANQAVFNKSVLILKNGHDNTALLTTMKTQEITVTPYIQFLQGGRGIASYIPVKLNNVTVGYFNALFNLQNLFHHYVTEELILNEYQISVFDDDQFVFNYNGNFTLSSEFVKQEDLPIKNESFEIYLILGPTLQQSMSFFSNPFLLLLGVAISIICGYVVYILISRNEEKTKRKVEEQKFELLLYQYDRMNALGALAGGLAHDFNNILMSLQANFDLMRMLPDHGGSYDEVFDTVDRILKSSKDLTHRILAISRHKEFETKLLDLEEIVKDTIQVFESVKDRRIEVITNFTHYKSYAYVNYSHLSQCILNVLNNAADALENRAGAIFVSTTNVDITKLEDIQKYFRLRIIDNGCGIPEAELAKVFDPFYTTKDLGKGTGLGLNIVQQYITKVNGSISVNSTVGTGTELVIDIPVVDHQVDELEDNENDTRDRLISTLELFRETYNRNPSILLVDDELIIANTVKKMLLVLDIDTTVSYDGKSAYGDYQDQSYDLVILDINLPKLNGIDLAQMITKSNPNQRMLFITGFTELEIPESLSQFKVLKKPFSNLDLFEYLILLLSIKVQDHKIR